MCLVFRCVHGTDDIKYGETNRVIKGFGVGLGLVWYRPWVDLKSIWVCSGDVLGVVLKLFWECSGNVFGYFLGGDVGGPQRKMAG